MFSNPLEVESTAPVTHLLPAHDGATDDPPPTERIGAFELAYALAAMEDDVQQPISDDDPTIELPAPPLPAGLPSPLGDDGLPPSSVTMPFETLTIDDLELELDEVFPPAAPAPLLLDAERLARRAVIASWTVAIATFGFCTYLLAAA